MKITYEEASYIRRYDKKHFMERYFYDWYIEKINDCSGYMRLYMKWWFYILAFIPATILQILLCMWDGGLKSFCFQPRELDYSYVVGSSSAGAESKIGRFKEIWNKYNKE